MKYLLLVFILLSILNLIGIGYQWSLLIFLTKPLLIPILALWYYFKTNSLYQRYSKFFISGLIFSTIGDTLLMFVAGFGEVFFLAGLFSFLIAHLNYIIAFALYPKVSEGFLFSKKWLFVPFLLGYLAIYFFLQNSLGAYLLPILVYALVIITMAAFSINMTGRTTQAAAKLLSYGSLLFVLSDLMIALKKFKYPEMNDTLSGLGIMSTYLLGQFFMTKGMVGSTK